MTVACVASLVECLVQLQLLEPAQLEELTESLQTRFPEPRELAHELMRRNWLTPYQVNQIFVGGGPDLLLGHYILLERLGEGGMGQVFKARHRVLGRLVAVKLLQPQFLDNAMAVRRFRREMLALAQLDHPNIVRAFDADEVNGACYFAMEYVEGTDLGRLLKQQGPLPVAQACDYIRQAALGLQHAHERGLVHRDVKPHNLLVSPASQGAATGSSALLRRPANCLGHWGTVKVLDLGLARLQEREGSPGSSLLTQAGSVMGTPDFIAPEQARNFHACDIRADIYSLGCTLYYLLSGEVPFPEGTLTEKLLQHQLDDPRPLEEARRAHLLGSTPTRDAGFLEVPGRVAALVRKLMSKCPEQRLQTPAEVAEELTAILAGAESGNSRPLQRDPGTLALASAVSSSHKQSEETKASPASPPSAIQPPAVTTQWPPQPRRRWPARARQFLLLGGVFLVSLLGFRLLPTSRSITAEPDTAEAAWGILVQKARQPGAKLLEVRQELLAFHRAYPATRADRVVELLLRLPSPLDDLNERWIPGQERFAWQPNELVAVLGVRRLSPRVSTLAVALSQDGRQVAGGWEDNLVKVWTVDSGERTVPRVLRKHTGRVAALAYAPDGRTLASGGHDGLILVWDAIKGSLRTRLEGHTGPVVSLAFAPHGDTLASGSWDGSVRLWNTATGRSTPLLESGPNNKVLSVAFSPEGALLACGRQSGGLALVSLGPGGTPRNPPVIRTPARHIVVAAFSPDGRRLVSGCGDGSLLVAELTPLGYKDGAILKGHTSLVHRVAFSPDGRTLASAGSDGQLILWDVVSGTRLRDWQLRWPIQGVAFASDGRHLVTANANGTLYVLRLGEPASPERLSLVLSQS